MLMQDFANYFIERVSEFYLFQEEKQVMKNKMPGDVGARGPQGEIGAQGPNGTRVGDRGRRGPKGIMGLTGPKGYGGIKGDTGFTGNHCFLFFQNPSILSKAET